ncbi:hypothetical protein [Pedobacter aquae]|nr:hypothetical protein [Pedobacter aquae]
MVDWSYFQPKSNTVKSSINLEFPRYLPEQFADLPLVHLKIPVQSAQISVHVKPLQTQLSKQFNSLQIAKIEQNIWFDYQVVEEQKSFGSW